MDTAAFLVLAVIAVVTLGATFAGFVAVVHAIERKLSHKVTDRCSQRIAAVLNVDDSTAGGVVYYAMQATPKDASPADAYKNGARALLNFLKKRAQQ